MNRINLAGRSAIVTGAARGIGRAIAERLAASGARVAIWDVDAGAATATAAAIEGAASYLADVTDPRSIAAALAATVAQIGPPAILVNKPGYRGRISRSTNTRPRNGGGSSRSTSSASSTAAGPRCR
ncbi:MAG TPA: SDR family NAD(P)-dependent oxidoreductase [Stellaceae bacterium]|nr:SDR family NAD(P)-dependent oxidoreductase [Stellaceae bacterium]